MSKIDYFLNKNIKMVKIHKFKIILFILTD